MSYLANCIGSAVFGVGSILAAIDWVRVLVKRSFILFGGSFVNDFGDGWQRLGKRAIGQYW